MKPKGQKYLNSTKRKRKKSRNSKQICTTDLNIEKFCNNVTFWFNINRSTISWVHYSYLLTIPASIANNPPSLKIPVSIPASMFFFKKEPHYQAFSFCLVDKYRKWKKNHLVKFQKFRWKAYHSIIQLVHIALQYNLDFNFAEIRAYTSFVSHIIVTSTDRELTHEQCDYINLFKDNPLEELFPGH